MTPGHSTQIGSSIASDNQYDQVAMFPKTTQDWAVTVGGFDFEAVVLYVLRWDLVYRWLMYNGPRARQRFERMADTALEEWLA